MTEKNNINYDVIIIGSGIIGTNIAYELSKFELKIALLEAKKYPASETTTGNSGIIHCGFDPSPGKLKAKFNVLGHKLWTENIFKKIIFPRQKAKSVVLAFDSEEEKIIYDLYKRGIINGLDPKNLSILSKKELKLAHPDVSEEAVLALECLNSWVVDPVKAAYAFLEISRKNGLEFFSSSKVISISKNSQNFFLIKTENQNNPFFQSKIIINAAGHYADEIGKIAGFGEFSQKQRRGQYLILKNHPNIKNIYFLVPSKYGKGVIVAPRPDGNILVGPTAKENIPKNKVNCLDFNLNEEIQKIGHKIIPSLDYSETVFALAGSRPIEADKGDFVIKPAFNDPNFIFAAGMQSPGLSDSPAIALEIVNFVKNRIDLVKKTELVEAIEYI
ncbi:type 2 glycerol-3-phosphate oxidase [Mesomycoplasma hyopneumoniae]|uniref:Type 2 glycerol-3-phosphate oxidase n=1 Tax=Mesomycoplasma hyopneumoniae TaxID=2099 RepID=A0ABD4SXA8_MESHO|nr:type 2 glycerol-3-phosphate oxidase [Mesomycoplasma hyopneumoniae]MCI8283616.1 type 2 glycerol-3-phosphate oxidase [Mesomycoplasma hyopneumoniae]MCI8298538.1 type 2 glycerol-3-phosphate oxidase [Mesomycoplasma hyopneumoniae]MCI8298706.1 type 2 glycerol-3-phosphate oxidase [Mesomycoplasma hyopneumoniae]